MCGIVGIAAFHKKEFIKRKEFINQGILASSLRGVDGTGMFMIPIEKDEEIKIIKKPIPGYDFIGLSQVEELVKNIEHYKFVVAHTRLKTRGEIKAAHTHPFSIGPITMVHNGMISNAYALAGNKLLDVDSMAAAHALAATDDPKAALESLEGAFALVWHDERKDALFLARNSERPLFFGVDKDKEMLVFASELRMLDWIADRVGISLEEKRWDVGENQILMLTDSVVGKLFKFKKKEVKNNWFDNGRDAYGKFIPKNQVIEQVGTHIYGHPANSYLHKHGMTVGDEVTFYFTEWELNTSKSRHGTLIGTQSSGKWLEVKAQGVPFKNEYSISTMFKSNITGAYVLGEEVTLIVSSKLIKLGEGSKNLIQFKKKEDSKVEIITSTEQVKGPIGFLETDEFSKLVEDGCASCSAPVFPKDSSKLRWTVDGAPVCATCALVYKDSAALIQ